MFTHLSEINNLDENEDTIYDLPYHKTICKLKEMQWIQSPTSKLDHIYNCLKFNLADEIDEFYNYCGHKIDHHLN